MTLIGCAALCACGGPEDAETNMTNMTEMEAVDPALEDVADNAMDANMGADMSMEANAAADAMAMPADSFEPSTAGNPNPPIVEEPPPQPRDR